MFTPLHCRVRAEECQKMAQHAPNPRVRSILMDMARTWTRLGLEAEHVAPTKGDVLQFVQATPLLKTRVRERRPHDANRG